MLEQALLEKDTHMTNKHMKRYATTSLSKKIQIKTMEYLKF